MGGEVKTLGEGSSANYIDGPIQVNRTEKHIVELKGASELTEALSSLAEKLAKGDTFKLEALPVKPGEFFNSQRMLEVLENHSQVMLQYLKRTDEANGTLSHVLGTLCEQIKKMPAPQIKLNQPEINYPAPVIDLNPSIKTTMEVNYNELQARLYLALAHAARDTRDNVFQYVALGISMIFMSLVLWRIW